MFNTIVNNKRQFLLYLQALLAHASPNPCNNLKTIDKIKNVVLLIENHICNLKSYSSLI